MSMYPTFVILEEYFSLRLFIYFLCNYHIFKYYFQSHLQLAIQVEIPFSNQYQSNHSIYYENKIRRRPSNLSLIHCLYLFDNKICLK